MCAPKLNRLGSGNVYCRVTLGLRVLPLFFWRRKFDVSRSRPSLSFAIPGVFTGICLNGNLLSPLYPPDIPSAGTFFSVVLAKVAITFVGRERNNLLSRSLANSGLVPSDKQKVARGRAGSGVLP